MNSNQKPVGADLCVCPQIPSAQTNTTSTNNKFPNRKSIRLKGYDYSQAGLYFITICTQNREHLFGNVENGKMLLNDAGIIIKNEWLKIRQRFTNIQLHKYIIMPNHFHAILEIVGATLVVAPNDAVAPNDVVAPNDNNINDRDDIKIEKGQPQGFAPTKKTLGDMVGAFQSITTVKYIHGVKTKNWKSFNGKLWQRNYWEHIIRDENSYYAISEYIENNPKNWNYDKLNIVENNIIKETETIYNKEIWMV